MPSGCHASELNLEIKMYNDLYAKKKKKKVEENGQFQ